MREFIKGIWVVLILVGVIGTPLAWGDDRPNEITWLFRVGGPVLAIAAFIALWRMLHRKDEVPDYLSQITSGFFDRDGFCFAFVTRTENRICLLDVYFQNRHEGSCRGRIALRPARGFFGRRRIEAVGCEIACGPAAFGVATICLPLPIGVQGKRQKFEVGASVEYPDGKGRMLRFSDGLALRADSDFGDAFGTTLGVAGALVGVVNLSSPATVTIDLPANVAEDLPEHANSPARTLWQLGDAPLECVGPSA